MLDLGYATSTLGTDPTSAQIFEHVNCLDGWALGVTRPLEEVAAFFEAVKEPVEEPFLRWYPLFAAIDVGEMSTACPFYGHLDPRK